MAWHWLGLPLLSIGACVPSVLGLNPSTNTLVPPLQWINLTGLISGSGGPPPLKDATIGYYNDQRTLLIFGGESADGIAQSDTFLLDLGKLVWSQPDPLPSETGDPPARSSALYGDDFSSSYRNAHIVIGGKDENGNALDDVWEYDFVSQAWDQVIVSPGGPSARWSAAGGTYADTTANFTDSPYGNNTVLFAGGFDGKNLLSLSDVWRFSVSGVLSSNNRQSTFGSWQSVPAETNNLPSVANQASTVMSSVSVVSVGGCNVSDTDNFSCAVQDSVIIDVGGSDSQPTTCVAPRLGGALTPNRNQYSTTFANQAFLLLGLFNETLWDDNGALAKGEVDILDTQAGTWTRVLPSGDPGTAGGPPAFPSPREGSAAYAWPSALVGGSPSSSSDIIVFGGKDRDGNYLNELWLLRAYNDVLDQTNASWTPSGSEVTGVNASGTGVTIQYVAECATRLKVTAPVLPTTTATSTASTQTSGASPSSSVATPTPFAFDTSLSHKILSPVSILLVFTFLLTFRTSYPSSGVNTHNLTKVFFWTSIPVGLAAYALGLAGLALAFISIHRHTSSTTLSSLSKRVPTSSTLLLTGHGRAGLALFIILYGLLSISCGIWLFHHRHASHCRPPIATLDHAVEEKTDPTTSILQPTSPRTIDSKRNSHVGSAVGFVRPTRGRTSTDSHSGDESRSSTAQTRTFEVINRPARNRRASGSIVAGKGFGTRRSFVTSPDLSDISWLERQRSVSAVGELEHALAHVEQEPRRPLSVHEEIVSANPLVDSTIAPTSEQPEPPSLVEGLLHFFIHFALLALAGLCLGELWLRAPKAAFAVFLLLTVTFYAALVVLAWHGRPTRSLLVVCISRLRGDPIRSASSEAAATAPPSRPTSEILDGHPHSPGFRSPYTHHRPPYRAVHVGLQEDDVTSQDLERGEGEETDDEDDDTRQRRMEAEMDRRNVTVFTIPKPRLLIANP